MLRGGPALATVFLCSVCLLAAPTRSRRKELCSLDRIKKVMSLNDALPSQMDVSLYTPSVEDYQKCPSAALSCFADELSVLCEEMKVSGLSCTQQSLSLSLRKLAEKLNKFSPSLSLEHVPVIQSRGAVGVNSTRRRALKISSEFF